MESKGALKRACILVLSAAAMMVGAASNHVFAQACGELISEAQPGAAWGNFGHMLVDGSTLYYEDGSAGLKIYDISNQSSPNNIAHMDEGGAELAGLVKQGNYLFVGGRWYNGVDHRCGIQVLSVVDPSQPTPVADVLTLDCQWAFDLVAVGSDHAYLGSQYGILIFDISSPFSPQFVDTIDIGFSYGLHRKNEFVYVVNPDGLTVFDTTVPTNPSEIGHVNTADYPYDVTVLSDIAYVADDSGLTVIDVSVPTSPQVLTFYPIQGVVKSVSGAGSVVAAASFRHGLAIFDMSDPNSPRLAGEITGDDYSQTVMVSSGVAYFAANSLQLRDVTSCGTTHGSEHQYVVAGAANVRGAQGTNWKSDIALLNGGQDSAQVSLSFLEIGRENSNPPTVSFSLNGGTQRIIQDVLVDLFSRTDTSGVILVDSSRRLFVNQRTYNDQGASGTFGQSIQCDETADVLQTGDVGYLQPVHENQRFRSNLGLVNVSSRSISVTVRAYRSGGGLLGEVSYNLRPFENIQRNQFLTLFTGQAQTGAYATITTSTPSAKLLGYVSVVDNRTGDPVFIPASPAGP